MDVHTYNNYVVRHNSENHFVVNHNKYETTLRQWLEKKENKNNWCDDYEKWDACRPKEEARKIIQGILRAVYELHSHSHNSSHGRLYHPENYAIQDNEVVIGGDHKENKYIFLMHENLKLNKNFDVLDNPQWGDRLAVSNLIFHQILAGPNGTFVGRCNYPDLWNLHDLLQKRDLHHREWKLMVNHPSLWHWKSRFVYFDRVWMYFKQAANLGNSSEYLYMKRSFSNIKPEKDWKKKIPHDSPLIEVYNYNGENSYRESTEELIRYIRNVRAHYKEIVQRNQKGQRYARKYLEPQYIELEVSKLSEPFLVKLYDIMCWKDIEI